MLTHSSNDAEHRKVADLSIGELSSLISKITSETIAFQFEASGGKARPKVNRYGMPEPQVIQLSEQELMKLVRDSIASYLSILGLTKEKLLSDFQRMITKALEEIIPKRDPEEDIYFTSKEVELFLGISHTTVSKFKYLYFDGKPILEFEGLGRIQRITKAACRRAMKHIHLRPSALKKRNEFPERLRKNNKKK